MNNIQNTPGRGFNSLQIIKNLIKIYDVKTIHIMQINKTALTNKEINSEHKRKTNIYKKLEK